MPTTLVPFQSSGWRYLIVAREDAADRSAVDFDDTGWPIGDAPFGNGPLPEHFNWVPMWSTNWPTKTRLWLRRTLPPVAAFSDVLITGRIEDSAVFYVNGIEVKNVPPAGPFQATMDLEFNIPPEVLGAGNNVLAVAALNELGPSDVGDDPTYLDVSVAGLTYPRRRAPALRGRQRSDGLGSSSAPRGRQTGSRQASLRGRGFL